jgi:amidohydrolase
VTVAEIVDKLAGRIADVARQIHARPELAYEERFAAELLAGELEKDGIAVERGAGGVPTALRARFGSPGGARVAIVAEYDALPEIGHACGHNLIAAGALGAALALNARGELGGEVVFLGTPAEEGGGGKIQMLEAGLFAGLDAAMMFHPLDQTVLWQGALAMRRVEIVFHGKASHAAGSPWDGASALRAVISTFNLIDSARVHLRDGARIHGYISDGGKAVNIIPERAAAAFSVRAPTAAYLEEVLAMVRACAEAAALATGTRLELTLQMGYKDMRNNRALARRFGEHLTAIGVPSIETDPEAGIGSTDMGDVSYEVPTIHPYLAVCAKGETMCHEREFTLRTASDAGVAAAIAAAKAMALTTLDILGDAELRAAARTEFSKK